MSTAWTPRKVAGGYVCFANHPTRGEVALHPWPFSQRRAKALAELCAPVDIQSTESELDAAWAVLRAFCQWNDMNKARAGETAESARLAFLDWCSVRFVFVFTDSKGGRRPEAIGNEFHPIADGFRADWPTWLNVPKARDRVAEGAR